IKQLFVAHGRPEFPGFFARAYEPAVRAGGVSWLGRDDAGQVVMHVGGFPRRFRFGTRDVVGGLLVNALVAESYRSFFPARALMRRARGDIEARGDIDFLYTDPNDQARAVLEVSGFRRIGTLARLVLPVGDRRWLVDGAAPIRRVSRPSTRFAANRSCRSGMSSPAWSGHCAQPAVRGCKSSRWRSPNLPRSCGAPDSWRGGMRRR